MLIEFGLDHHRLSDSNIFSFSLARRFAQGWSARAIYTTGRTLDANSSNDNGVGGGRNIIDAENVNGQWGRADFDIQRRLSVDSLYELPNPIRSGFLKVMGGG